MERVYAPQANGAGEAIRLEGERAHYLLHVHRLREQDRLLVFDGRGLEYEAAIEAAGKRQVTLRLLTVSRAEEPLKPAFVLAQGLAKLDKLEWVIQKTCELGVARIRPFTSRFGTVKSGPGRAEGKLERWRAIAEEACRQSGRCRLPRIDAPVDFETLVAEALTEGPLWMAYERARGAPLKDLFAGAPPLVTLMVGPEGGFAPEEAAFAGSRGARLVSLGPRTLRTETAAVAWLAIAQYALGDMT